MKCCCNRYTGGIIIGSIYIAVSILFLAFSSISYVEYEKKFKQNEHYKEKLKSDTLTSIIAWSTSVLICALFIVAIVKRLPYLILPWFLVCIYWLYEIGQLIYIWFVGAAMAGASPIIFLIVLLIGVLVFGLQIAVIVFGCYLFKYIHQENKEKAVFQLSDPLTDRSFI